MDKVEKIIESLEKSTNSDDIINVLKNNPEEIIEQLCTSFPIESLHLDYESVQRDFNNCKRFEIVIYMAQILARYDEIGKQQPELHLPSKFPAEKFTNILLSRIIPFVSKQEGIDIAQIIRVRLYDFAMELIKVGRYSDALICLQVSKPSIKQDHEFWIFACYYNIAQDSKKKIDFENAINTAESILKNDNIVTGVKQNIKGLLNKLKTQKEELNY